MAKKRKKKTKTAPGVSTPSQLDYETRISRSVNLSNVLLSVHYIGVPDDDDPCSVCTLTNAQARQFGAEIIRAATKNAGGVKVPNPLLGY